MKTLVSVIIPVYNDVLVVEAVESVLKQTYKNIEIIVIDDGSESYIAKLLEQYSRKIQYKKTINQGAAAARNKGIFLSKGKYIAFLDSDDLFLPNKIEKQVRLMRERKALFSYTGYKRIDLNTGKEISIINYNGKTVKYPEILSSCGIAMPTVMLDREILNGKLFNEHLHIAEDVCAWIDISYKHNLFVLDEILTIVRTDENSSAYNKYKLRMGILNIINHIAKNEEYSKHELECWQIIMYYASLYKPENQSNKKITSIERNIFVQVLNYYRMYGLKLTLKKIIDKFI